MGPHGTNFHASYRQCQAVNANAVQVVPVRSKANSDPVSLFFANVIGISTCDVSASATACRTGNTSTYSMIGLSGISFSGSGYTDSYNSANGPYSAGSANKKGGIASNGNITLANTVSINGDARCGVGKTTTITGSATVSGLNAPLGAVVKFPSVACPRHTPISVTSI